MACVLVIDDDPDSRLFLSKLVESLRVCSLVADSAETAMELLEGTVPDLILLDVQMPKTDGLQFYAALQAHPKYRRIQVLFVSANGQTSAKLAAFSLGAEDYVVKPYDPLEMRARIESRLRKIQQEKQGKEIFLANLKIDLGAQRVWVMDRRGEPVAVRLTHKEFKILSLLAQNPEQVLTRSRLIEKVWDPGEEIFDRTVDTHISSIRSKLGTAGKLIQSVPGSGYRLGELPKPHSKAS